MDPTPYQSSFHSHDPFDVNAYCKPIHANHDKSETKTDTLCDIWGKYGPIMKNQQQDVKELPPVLTMKFVTNVKIQDTTSAKSYNW